MVVLDQCTRRIIGFALHAGTPDGPAVCRMLDQVISEATGTPSALSSDHDPLFEFQRWQANLRILDVVEIKSVPHVPLSHPFIERLIGTIRREFLDHVPFWGSRDLQRKLHHFRDYYNRERTHAALAGCTPHVNADNARPPALELASYRWRSHCRGLYRLPAAA